MVFMSKNTIRTIIKKDNEQLVSLIKQLVISNKPIWKKVAYELAKPRRSRVQVNLNKIERFTKDSEVILVPGKVLGSGRLSKKATVAAFSFSEGAKKIIHTFGGKTLSITDVFTTNPQGKQVVIIT